MVMNNREDPLWTLAGEEKADAKLRAAYQKMGAGAAAAYATSPPPTPLSEVASVSAAT
jgi:hypothetical protein